MFTESANNIKAVLFQVDTSLVEQEKAQKLPTKSDGVDLDDSEATVAEA